MVIVVVYFSEKSHFANNKNNCFLFSSFKIITYIDNGDFKDFFLILFFFTKEINGKMDRSKCSM